MIIKRIAQAIKRQDISQIIIEILIVIVGIFLGLQVQAWYEAREDKQKEAYYLNRLLSDMDRSIDAQSTLLINNKFILNRADIISHNITARRTDEAAEKYFYEHFSPLGAIDYLPTFYPDTLDELYDIGALQLMRGNTLKSEIYALRQKYRDYLFQTEMVQESSMTNFYKVYDKVRTMGFIKNKKWNTDIQIDIEELINDDSFVSSFSLYLGGKHWGEEWLLKFHRECVNFRNLLANDLGKPEVKLKAEFANDSFLDNELSVIKLE